MEFDESKIYTLVTADKVKIGSKGFFSDNLMDLKNIVERERSERYGKITGIKDNSYTARFQIKVEGNYNYGLFYLVEEPKVEVKPLSLNEIAKLSYENARKREENGGHISAKTQSMLKHCATEVVEATEAYSRLNFEKLVFSAETKRKFASELADIICCCTIIAGRERIDLDKAVADCLEKNRKRAEGTGDKL